MYYRHFRILVRVIWQSIILLAALLMIARGWSFFEFANWEQVSSRSMDVARAFLTGLKFDLKVAAIGLAPAYLLGMAFAASRHGFGWFQRGLSVYLAVLALVVVSASIGNYYYYLTFGNHFDIFVFGLGEDDTVAVLQNIWVDYPVVQTFLVSVVSATGVLRLGKLIRESASNKVYKPLNKWLVTVAVLVALVPYTLAVRGSAGALPLKRYHAQVSDYDLLNKLTPNAFMALDWARTDKAKESSFFLVSKEALKGLSAEFGQSGATQTAPESAYLEQNPPHIVLALMESMGSNVLAYDDPETNDLLGALRPHFEEDFVFPRFVSGTNATIDSMVMMLFHSPVPTISHSSVQKVRLTGSAVLPYKKAGYRVVFITAGNGMWRNLSNYFPRQGFDEVLDENTIKKVFPEAAKDADTWGVPDEYAFKLAEKILKEAKQPTFVMVLTVTNHSPYRPPESYRPAPVYVSADLAAKNEGSQVGTENMLKAYQYASDSLGQFISSIKSSPLSGKTVIAATGDHRMRRMMVQDTEDLATAFGVPFYLYVPQEIQNNVDIGYEKLRPGSHKDIFPTLYALSLSGAEYTSLGGRNMLAVKDDPIKRFGYHGAILINDRGVVTPSQPGKLYLWKDNSIEPVPVENPDVNRHQQFREWLSLYINSQMAGYK